MRTGATPPGSADAIAVSSQPPATQGSALCLNGTVLRSSGAYPQSGWRLRALSSDAHLTGPDLAATKGDAALGTDCYNVSTVKIDATTLKTDASTVSIDLSTLTSDIGVVTQDVAAMKNDLVNLNASGLPATPGAAAAIAAAGKTIGQAAAKANGEIDQVNADVTQAYSIADGMATGSCAGDGPGRPPVPIGHLPSN